MRRSTLSLQVEHLENAFYSGALAPFDKKTFHAAGLPSEARVRLSEVAAHDVTHVAIFCATLALLGGNSGNATQPCTYSLSRYVFFLEICFRRDLRIPYYEVHSFTALSQVLEGVGEILLFFVEMVHFNFISLQPFPFH